MYLQLFVVTDAWHRCRFDSRLRLERGSVEEIAQAGFITFFAFIVTLWRAPQVTMSTPRPEGTFHLASVSIRGLDVTGRDPFNALSDPIRTSADLHRVRRQKFGSLKII